MPRHLSRVLIATFALAAFTLPVPPGDAGPRASADDDTLAALAALTTRAVDADASVAEAAITSLRERGPAGHAALVRAHEAAITTLRERPTLPLSPETERLRHAFDRVSGQRDSHASGLYFHSDLEAALAEARVRHVPVLSFRLLGRLDDEMSCANSRYFRTLVYSDPTVARFMRERFVMHASTERPAPTITIAMGDGRTMVGTITGNSVHYVLDAEGRVLDALPGLYAPADFIAALEASAAIAAACGARHGAPLETCLGQAHARALAALEARWVALRTQFGEQLPTWAVFTSRAPPPVAGPRAPSARSAMAETMSKVRVESALLDSFARSPTPQPYEGVNWSALVGLGAPPLSSTTLVLLRVKTGSADVDTLARELARNAMADALRNEFTMHRRVHAWFLQPAARDFASMNTRVYSELFLTPASDPWLGLRADDVWDAIESVH